MSENTPSNKIGRSPWPFPRATLRLKFLLIGCCPIRNWTCHSNIPRPSRLCFGESSYNSFTRLSIHNWKSLFINWIRRPHFLECYEWITPHWEPSRPNLEFLNARTQSRHLLQFTILVLGENLTLNNLLWRFLSTLRRCCSGLCYWYVPPFSTTNVLCFPHFL